jgi:hypothetical protein
MRSGLAASLLVLAFAVPASAADRDPLVEGFVRAVSAARLRVTDEHLVGFGTRSTFSTGAPAGRGIFAARDWLAAQFGEIASAGAGRMTVALDTYEQPKTSRTPRAVVVSSVVATLRGDDPSGRTYVISSHLDSRNSDGNDATRDAPGADDNASAVAAVVEAARILAAQHFPATIIFAAYDGEEQGLWGSEHHAALLAADEIPVDGDLNSDIIGASRGHDGVRVPNMVRVYAPGLGIDGEAPNAELGRFAKETVERFVPNFTVELIDRPDRLQRGGDQESFQHHGFPAVRFVEASEDYDHQHQDVRVENGRQFGDLIAFEDFDYLARVTRGLVATLAELALGPARPANAIQVLGTELAYDPTLRWDAVAGASGYEVVWRRTTDPIWTHARAVGNVTAATIAGYNRDRYSFGVRTVDANGRRSVVSPCTPKRVP